MWGGVIVGGYNRYKICREHKIVFRTEEKYFDFREDAVIWICQNQRGRRNITPEQRDYLLGKEYEATKGRRGVNSPQNEEKVGKAGVVAVIAKQRGVGRTTVERGEHFAQGVDKLAEVSPIAKQKFCLSDLA